MCTFVDTVCIEYVNVAIKDEAPMVQGLDAVALSFMHYKLTCIMMLLLYFA